MDAAAIQRRFTNIRNTAPKTYACVWNAKSFTGIPGDLKQDLKFSDYGAATGFELLILVPFDEIGATAPKVHDDITVDTVAKRIVAPVTIDPTGSCYVIQIGDERA